MQRVAFKLIYRCHTTWRRSNACRSSRWIIYGVTMGVFVSIVAVRIRILMSSKMLFTEDGNISTLNKLLRDQQVCLRLLTKFASFAVTSCTTRQRNGSTFKWTSHLGSRRPSRVFSENTVILVCYLPNVPLLFLAYYNHSN